jgi:uncharacterized membrane protein
MPDFERRKADAETVETIDSTEVVDLQLSTEAARRLQILSHITYGLYAVAWFTCGISGVVGLIIDYVKREEAGVSLYATHARWRIRTFWWTLLWFIPAGLFAMVGVGLPFLVAIGIWNVYRIIKGWLKLWELKAVP